MTKRIDSDLLLFVVDEFGELSPNLEYIQGQNPTTQERTENVGEPKHTRNALEQGGVSHTHAVVDRQENKSARTQSNGEMGFGLSQDNANAGRIATSRPSSATSSNGAGNFAAKPREISSGADGDGDYARNGGEFGALSASRTQDFKPEVSPSLAGGLAGRERDGGRADGLLEKRDGISSTTRDDEFGREKHENIEQNLSNTGIRSLNGQSSQQRGNSTQKAGNSSSRQADLRFDGQDLFAAQTAEREVGQNGGEFNERESSQTSFGRVSQTSTSSDTSSAIDFAAQKEPNFGSLKENLENQTQNEYKT